jgi:hypothetical protein
LVSGYTGSIGLLPAQDMMRTDALGADICGSSIRGNALASLGPKAI